MKSIFYLVFGICLGFAPFAWQNWPMAKRYTYEEKVIAQRLYRELDRYSGNYRLDPVLESLHELVENKCPLLPDKEVYEVITNLGIQRSEQIGRELLENAIQELRRLSQKEGVMELIKDYVYAEILEPGAGEQVVENDTVLIHFKQFSSNGKLIKDTTNDRPFKIPLSQTIRGFKKGLDGAHIGERRKIYIHPDWGFNTSLLIYEVTIMDRIIKP
ncbi:MAG: FKBP-type peptidyl-prolyl cis-trans isomerase [Chlamydiia bacterium]